MDAFVNERNWIAGTIRRRIEELFLAEFNRSRGPLERLRDFISNTRNMPFASFDEALSALRCAGYDVAKLGYDPAQFNLPAALNDIEPPLPTLCLSGGNTLKNALRAHHLHKYTDSLRLEEIRALAANATDGRITLALDDFALIRPYWPTRVADAEGTRHAHADVG